MEILVGILVAAALVAVVARLLRRPRGPDGREEAAGLVAGAAVPYLLAREEDQADDLEEGALDPDEVDDFWVDEGADDEID